MEPALSGKYAGFLIVDLLLRDRGVLVMSVKRRGVAEAAAGAAEVVTTGSGLGALPSRFRRGRANDTIPSSMLPEPHRKVASRMKQGVHVGAPRITRGTRGWAWGPHLRILCGAVVRHTWAAATGVLQGDGHMHWAIPHAHRAPGKGVKPRDACFVPLHGGVHAPTHSATPGNCGSCSAFQRLHSKIPAQDGGPSPQGQRSPQVSE